MVSRIILSTSKSHLKDIVKINHVSAESAALTTLMAVRPKFEKVDHYGQIFTVCTYFVLAKLYDVFSN